MSVRHNFDKDTILSQETTPEDLLQISRLLTDWEGTFILKTREAHLKLS